MNREDDISVEIAANEAEKGRVPGKLLILSGLIPMLLFIPILSVNGLLYNGIMSIDAIFVFLMLHSYFFARFYNGNKMLYGIYILGFIAISYLSLPSLTHSEAISIVEEKYIVLYEFDSSYPVERELWKLTEPRSF